MRPMQDTARPSLRRVLGVFDGVAVLVGITIGAGIFSVPQIIARYQSTFFEIILFWVLAGFFVFIGGLIYAELGTRLPNTGGEYVYLHRAFGPFVGFMFGWAQLFIIRTSPAAGLSLIAANYIGHFIPLDGWAHTAVALGIIVLLGGLNYVGLRQASIFQNATTFIKVFGLLALVVAGLIQVGANTELLHTRAEPTADLGPIGNIGALMLLVLFSYIGWDRVGYLAGEMKNPRRTIPPTMIYGLAVIFLLYLSANFIYHATLGMEGVRASKIVASEVATILFGPIGAGFVALLVIISCIGSINGTTMAAPRVYYAMSRDGLFFSWLDYVHPLFRTPSRAVLAQTVWASVILLVRQNFQDIVAGMTFAILIFYVMTTLALFKLRKQGLGEEACYKVPLYPYLPAVYLIGLVALIAVRGFFEWQNSLMDIAFIATGLPFALAWLRRRH